MQLVVEHLCTVLIAAGSLFWSESYQTGILKEVRINFVDPFFKFTIQKEKLKLYTFRAIKCFKNLSRYQLL